MTEAGRDPDGLTGHEIRIQLVRLYPNVDRASSVYILHSLEP